MIWSDFERATPSLAGAARARLEATRVALLGTIRRDGSPRISPIEPYFTSQDLLLGAMALSLKAADLARDPRCVLHSAISDPDAGETEFKLYGTAVAVVDSDRRNARSDAWWTSHAPEAALVFTLSIEQAASVTWALGSGEMTVTRWSESRGVEEATRSYP
ncbi:MAG: pyridoxamine 5'-phosphate oxidase family protein [Gaiellaceae bacterium]